MIADRQGTATRPSLALSAALALGMLAACRASEPVVPRSPEATHAAVGDELVVCGQRFSTGGAPVVLWFEEPNYSAYQTRPRFASTGSSELRYQPGRTPRDPALAAAVSREGWTLANLREQVDLLVLHYDVSGTSRSCFETLQDRRGLSVHFLLDVDGTLYQTLDLADQAWHARQANPRSIGVEIAQIGAYPPGADSPLRSWYEEGPGEATLVLPEGERGRMAGPYRAARPRAVRGVVQGRELEQYDFTVAQYVSLVRLARTLRRIFPRIEADMPRAADGTPRSTVLTKEEFEQFHGILGHLHVSSSKVDPGPAFQWEAFLREVRAVGPVSAEAFRGAPQRP